MKWSNRQTELTAIAMLMFKRLEITLLPIDRIIFLKLLINYGGRKISIKSLTILSEEIKIHRLALQKTLKVLIEKGLCEQQQGKFIRISRKLLPKNISYISKKKSAYKKSEILEKEASLGKRSDNLEIKKTAYEFVSSYKRYDFLVHLFDLIDDVRISHKQKNVDRLSVLNYKQWLVLVSMVLSSDRNGIILNLGTYELSKWTGLNRDALLRAITGLFNLGILRSKMHGTLNNNLLKSIAAVYCLNLSASIWEEKRIFGRYYLLKLPEVHVSITQQAFEFIDSLSGPYSDNKNQTLTELISRSAEDTYQIEKSELEGELLDEFYFISNFKKDFVQDIQPLRPKFATESSSFNSTDRNINRIKFLLNYYLLSNIHNVIQAKNLMIKVMPSNCIAWFREHLSPIQLSIDDLKNNDQQNLAFNESRVKVLFLIAQAILRSEVMPIITNGLKLENPKASFNLTLLPSQNNELCDSVYFCRYDHGAIEQKIKQDTFHLLEFEAISTHLEEYKLSCKELELDIKSQKKYGFFNHSNKQ